jgi:hypothetical protein
MGMTSVYQRSSLVVRLAYLVQWMLRLVQGMLDDRITVTRCQLSTLRLHFVVVSQTIRAIRAIREHDTKLERTVAGTPVERLLFARPSPPS